MQDIAKKRRILLMYITKVSGHRSATVAIERSIKEQNCDAEIMSINGFGYTHPHLEKVVNRAYMGVIRRTPFIWDFLYDNPKIVKNTNAIKNYLHKTSHKRLSRLFSEFYPDTVVCTQAFPCGMVADYKMDHQQNFTLIAVLTDFLPHSYWVNEGVDYYVVPSMEARDRLLTMGVAEDAIKLYGIPIRPRFAMQLDKKPIADRLGLDLDIPTILIMGGGQGLGPIKQMVKSLLKIASPFQMIVLAGVNKKLQKWLQEVKRDSSKKLLVYEYTHHVDDLMEVASLIITKPGGMTTAESLAKGLPMIIVHPIPGQEMRNTDFLLEKGIGIRVDKAEEIGEEVELLLKSPERLESMSKAAYENAKPHAALDIAKLILK
jgi:processive 1,2-diacylglycerol beta-glucosyltransferase